MISAESLAVIREEFFLFLTDCLFNKIHQFLEHFKSDTIFERSLFDDED